MTAIIDAAGRDHATKEPANWADVAGEVTALLERRMRPVLQKVADELYERMLFSVQDYLAENLKFNIGSAIRAAERRAQDNLDATWRAVNVLGAPDSACTTPEERGYCQAIADALAEIERLGGRPS